MMLATRGASLFGLVDLRDWICGALDEIDEVVLDELTDVIAARFHRSPATARDYRESLIRAVSSLRRRGLPHRARFLRTGHPLGRARSRSGTVTDGTARAEPVMARA